MSSILDYLDSIISEDSQLAGLLTQLVKRKAFPAHTVLTIAGDISNKIYYIEKGLIRGFYFNDNDEDNDITSWIVTEGHFATIPQSFLGRVPSLESIETLETSVLHIIDHTDLYQLYSDFPAINHLGRILTEQYLLQCELRLRMLRITSAEQRMAFFEKHYSYLLNRVMSKHIASFLGITPQTLSRLRSKRLRIQAF